MRYCPEGKKKLPMKEKLSPAEKEEKQKQAV
jgi:hypothetical protein